MQLPSRDEAEEDIADSTVKDESLELVKIEGESIVVGEDTSDWASSVSVFVGESKESLEGDVGGRSSRASCSSS